MVLGGGGGGTYITEFGKRGNMNQCKTARVNDNVQLKYLILKQMNLSSRKLDISRA